ncbi:hypothetical protein [Corynebacterium flavescens]|uniref:hypothetical protein n=1 Tax=Corynebacterium flavescens TaxID=28028 RepID=UPI003FD3F474
MSQRTGRYDREAERAQHAGGPGRVVTSRVRQGLVGLSEEPMRRIDHIRTSNDDGSICTKGDRASFRGLAPGSPVDVMLPR